MRKLPEECPGCESEQKFPLRMRSIAGAQDAVEVYISCTLCPYQLVIRQSTPDLERLYRRKAKLEARARNHERRWGDPSAGMVRAVSSIKHAISIEESKLREKVK